MTNHDSQPADTGQGGPRLHRFEDEERRPHRDPRDATDVDLEVINNQYHYTLYAVFRLTRPLPASQPEREQLLGESADFIEAGIPVLTAVAARHQSGWQRFTGGLHAALPADEEALMAWCQAKLARRKQEGAVV